MTPQNAATQSMAKPLPRLAVLTDQDETEEDRHDAQDAGAPAAALKAMISRTVPCISPQKPRISTVTLGRATAAATGYIRTYAPAMMLTMPMKSFQPQALWSLEHADDLDDAGDEPVNAHERDEQLIGLHLGLGRRPQQNGADQEGRDAHDEGQPPGALLRLQGCCGCCSH